MRPAAVVYMPIPGVRLVPASSWFFVMSFNDCLVWLRLMHMVRILRGAV